VQLREGILANLEKRKMDLKDQKDTHESIAAGVKDDMGKRNKKPEK